MPRQTPSTGRVPASSTSRPTAKSARVVGVAGARREHDVGVGEHLVGVDLVVLDHPRQHAGHRGDQVHQVPRVGVVVVDHDHVRVATGLRQ